MTLFSYLAVDEEGKQVRGSIESIDADAARKAIEDLHMEVTSIQEASRNKPRSTTEEGRKSDSASTETFAFEGTDPDKQIRRGTIQAASKREAFLKLHQDQKLKLSMLSRMGSLPKYNDPELQEWQSEGRVSVNVQSVSANPSIVVSNSVIPNASETSNLNQRPKVTLGFTQLPTSPAKPQATLGVQKNNTQVPLENNNSTYHSILSTLRLYAGWLLGWYGLFVAVGYYATVRALPWDIPFVRAFYESTLIFTFTIAIFLFLFFSEIHRLLKGRLVAGTILTVLGTVVFLGLRSLL